MTVKSKRHKRLITIAVLMVIVLFGWLYRELRPTVIFHTPQESKYLGKVFRPGGFEICRSLSIRIYNPPYNYPLCRSRIENPIGRKKEIIY